MTEIVPIQKFNESYIKFGCDAGILMELSDHFSFQVDGAKFQPKFKAGIWDGYLRLVNMNTRLLYAGLYEDVVEFCKVRNYHINLVDSPAYGLPNQRSSVLPDEVHEFVTSLNIHSKGNKLDERSYQLQAIYTAIKNERRTIVSSTGSGKSYIIYALMRWFVEQELRVLIIVPSTQLVHQMKGDFTDYSSHNGFDVDGNTNLIMSGKEKHLNNLVTLSTWQSLQLDRVNSGWLNSYDVIMVDECHQAGSKELSNLMSKATDVKYRFGFTGSLGKSKTNHMVIKGLFGPVSKVTTTKKLIEDGHLSKIEIMCLVLQYPPEIKSLFSSKVEYPKEVEFITSYERRNKFIRNLALSLEGNTLILYNFVEKHGEVLYDLIKEKAGDRPVHFIHGGVESEERDEVRAIIEGSSNSITVASLGTMSVGVNVKRLHNVILAHPTKSAIRIIQSIGRGLRLADGKTHLSLYDISDKLSKSKTKSNHTYRHFIERLSIYSQEEFDYKIVEVDIG